VAQPQASAILGAVSRAGDAAAAVVKEVKYHTVDGKVESV